MSRNGETIQRVSILIPVFNREEIILETLRSAVSQTYQNIEVVVVDNHSTDNTWGVITRFAEHEPLVKAYRNSSNIGPVRNWRECMNHASGDYVKILWSDDLVAPTFIEKTLPFLIENKDVGFVFTKTCFFYPDGTQTPHYRVGTTGLYDSMKFIRGALIGNDFPVSPGNALFRRADLDRNLMLDIPNGLGVDFTAHGMGNDLLLFLLTAKDYPQFAYVDEALSFFRVHGDSISVREKRFRLLLIYHVAKAYFVENRLQDEYLKKQFDTILWVLYIQNRFRRALPISSVDDFYMAHRGVRICWNILLALALKKISNELKRIKP